MKYDTQIGIDPGAAGGIAVITKQDSWAIAMPETDFDMAKEISYLSRHINSFCVLEKVHSMPRDGNVGAFSFGQNFGMVRQALTCNMIPYELVPPQKWQKFFGLPTKKSCGGSITVKKNHHKALAQQLFPRIKVTHKIADALLIAEFCRRTRG